MKAIWHHASKELPKDGQWVITIGAPRGRFGNETRVEWIAFNIYRFEPGKFFNVWRTPVGVDVIMDKQHLADLIWTEIPAGRPPYLETWPETDRPMEERFLTQ